MIKKRTSFTWIDYAILAALVGTAILAPIGAVALAVYLVFIGGRYLKR